MRSQPVLRPTLLLSIAAITVPAMAMGQEASAEGRPLTQAALKLPDTAPNAVLLQNSGHQRDSLVNGMLIGAGIGAVVGMLVAPPAFCGAHDTECATIVRVAIGLPAIAGGMGVGALVDARW